jgi:hypothetical protein
MGRSECYNPIAELSNEAGEPISARSGRGVALQTRTKGRSFAGPASGVLSSPSPTANLAGGVERRPLLTGEQEIEP